MIVVAEVLLGGMVTVVGVMILLDMLSAIFPKVVVAVPVVDVNVVPLLVVVVLEMEMTGTMHGGGYAAHDRFEFSMDWTQQPTAPPGRRPHPVSPHFPQDLRQHMFDATRARMPVSHDKSTGK